MCLSLRWQSAAGNEASLLRTNGTRGICPGGREQWNISSTTHHVQSTLVYRHKTMNVCYSACVFLKCLLGLNCKLQHLALRYSVVVLDSRMVSSQSRSSGVVRGKFFRKSVDETCNLNTCLLSNRHFNTHKQHLCLPIHKHSLSHAPLPKCMTDCLMHSTNLIINKTSIHSQAQLERRFKFYTHIITFIHDLQTPLDVTDNVYTSKEAINNHIYSGNLALWVLAAMLSVQYVNNHIKKTT